MGIQVVQTWRQKVLFTGPFRHKSTDSEKNYETIKIFPANSKVSKQNGGQ